MTNIWCILRIRISFSYFIVKLEMTLSGQLHSFCILNGMRELWMETCKDFYEFYSSPPRCLLSFYHIHQQHIQLFELVAMGRHMKKHHAQFHCHRLLQHVFLRTFTFIIYYLYMMSPPMRRKNFKYYFYCQYALELFLLSIENDMELVVDTSR